MNNRIKYYRALRGWSMRQLAEHIHTTISTVNKLEKGEIRLSLDWMTKIARALEVEAADLIPDSERVDQFAEEASVYMPEPANQLGLIRLDNNQCFYKVNGCHLDQIGILPGDVVVIDQNANKAGALRTGDVVLAQLHYEQPPAPAPILLRQFVAPSLLITNSSEKNSRIINMRDEKVILKGTVISSHREAVKTR